MPHIANETDEEVTYTDTGPGGGPGDCNMNKLRPLQPHTKVEDNSIHAGYRVCFFDEHGSKFLDDSASLPSKKSTVSLHKLGPDRYDARIDKFEMSGASLERVLGELGIPMEKFAELARRTENAHAEAEEGPGADG